VADTALTTCDGKQSTSTGGGAANGSTTIFRLPEVGVASRLILRREGLGLHVREAERFGSTQGQEETSGALRLKLNVDVSASTRRRNNAGDAENTNGGYAVGIEMPGACPPVKEIHSGTVFVPEQAVVDAGARRSHVLSYLLVSAVT
jgi:hypothetical protein